MASDNGTKIFYENFYSLFGELCEKNVTKIKFAEIFVTINDVLTKYINSPSSKKDSFKPNMVILKQKLDHHKKSVLKHEEILADMSPLVNHIIEYKKKQ